MDIEEFKTFFPLGKDFRVSGGPPASKRYINTVQKRIGFKFPRNYIEFLESFGSLYIEVSEEVWPRTKELYVLPHWQCQYGLAVMGIGKKTPDHLNVEKVYHDFQSKFNPEFKIIPVIKEIMITQYYYCMDEGGTVYFWSFLEPWPKRVLDNLFRRLSRLIEELIAKKDHFPYIHDRVPSDAHAYR